MNEMNQLDVAGLLRTYAEKAGSARSTEKLKDVVRNLKRELNSDAIKKMTVYSK
jgi:hypothetical protein